MFTCKVENMKHEILKLTQDESNYQVISISGLNPPNAQINRNTVTGVDGTKFNSAKLQERNIVITLKLNGDVEGKRLFLYSFFPTKQWCKFYYKNGLRDVYIEGYVETVEVNLFTQSQIMQISIICPDPYFKALEVIVDDISKALANFTFPFAINSNSPIEFSTLDNSRVTNVINESESESGLCIDIKFVGTVSKLLIKNTTTNESFTVRYNFIANDKLSIVTNRGQKSVKLTRNATVYNLIPNVVRGSIFFQLAVGENQFTYLADDGDSDHNIEALFKHQTIYRGV